MPAAFSLSIRKLMRGSTPGVLGLLFSSVIDCINIERKVGLQIILISS